MTTVEQPTPPLGGIIVTGGCGFLGSHIVDLLLRRYPPSSSDTSVHVLDLHTSRNTRDGAKYHTCDLTNPESVRETLDNVKPNVVIHTASPVFTSGTAKSLEIMRKVNVEGTKTLIEECKRIGGVKALVYTGSASVVSDQRTNVINADERWLVLNGEIQREYYSQTKAEAEEYVLQSNTQPNASSASSPSTTPLENTPLLTCSLRPSGMFGEGDVQLIPGMLRPYLNGQTNFQIGDNDNLFDWTYVGNVAHAHHLAAIRLLQAWDHYAKRPGKSLEEKKAVEKSGGGPATDTEEEDKVDGEAFFISNGSPIYFWDFVRGLWNAYDKHAPPGKKRKPPTPPSKVWLLSFEFAFMMSTIASWLFWILRLGEPKLDPARVRFSCMTRYFRLAKAQTLLGYKPVVEISDAVERSAKWFAERDAEMEGKKER